MRIYRYGYILQKRSFIFRKDVEIAGGVLRSKPEERFGQRTGNILAGVEYRVPTLDSAYLGPSSHHQVTVIRLQKLPSRIKDRTPKIQNEGFERFWWEQTHLV